LVSKQTNRSVIPVQIAASSQHRWLCYLTTEQLRKPAVVLQVRIIAE